MHEDTTTTNTINDGEDDPFASCPFFKPMGQPAGAVVLNKDLLFSVLKVNGTDDECASLFGYSVEEFRCIVNADPELKRVYRDARNVGRIELKMAQYNSAILGDKVMLKHLGEHTLHQVDAQAQVNVNVNTAPEISEEEMLKRVLLSMKMAEQSGLEPIDVTPIEPEQLTSEVKNDEGS